MLPTLSAWSGVLTASTRAPVHMEPMFSMSTSFLASLDTCRAGGKGGRGGMAGWCE